MATAIPTRIDPILIHSPEKTYETTCLPPAVGDVLLETARLSSR